MWLLGQRRLPGRPTCPTSPCRGNLFKGVMLTFIPLKVEPFPGEALKERTTPFVVRFLRRRAGFGRSAVWKNGEESRFFYLDLI